MWKDTFKLALDVLKYNQDIWYYNSKSFFKRLFMKKPVSPSNKFWEELAFDYIKELKSHLESKFGKLPKEIYVAWQRSPNNIEQRAYPIIEYWICHNGCYYVTRQAFKPNGTTEEWGCPYPYSECGITGRSDEEDYTTFDKILDYIKNELV